ncbi:uncharacterized protein LOC115700355 [Cannabis sativa]|uniref:uncharacterized protein LOC115700355 n=1 Tax=Cannabis sativa TaxID=3483 RepID=UPI0029CA4F2C|nr:uncharacterized protein LOC115700355 [Cannabis sativa]
MNNNNDVVIHKISSYSNSITVEKIINLNNPNNIKNYHNQEEEPIIQFQFKITYHTKLTTGYGHVSNIDDNYTIDGTIADVRYSPTSEAIFSRPLGIEEIHCFEATYNTLSPVLLRVGVRDHSAKSDVSQNITKFCERFIINNNNNSRLIVCVLVEMEREIEQWECVSCSMELANIGANHDEDESYWMADSMGIVDLHLEAYKVGEDDEKLGESCSVCLEEFEVGTKGAKMPNCLHLFHVNCIGNWLRRNQSCPICRSQLYPTFLF